MVRHVETGTCGPRLCDETTCNKIGEYCDSGDRRVPEPFVKTTARRARPTPDCKSLSCIQSEALRLRGSHPHACACRPVALTAIAYRRRTLFCIGHRRAVVFARLPWCLPHPVRQTCAASTANAGAQSILCSAVRAAREWLDRRGAQRLGHERLSQSRLGRQSRGRGLQGFKAPNAHRGRACSPTWTFSRRASCAPTLVVHRTIAATSRTPPRTSTIDRATAVS